MTNIDKKSIVNDLYQAALISVFVVGYSILGQKVPKMTPPSIQKFDLNETVKLILIVAASDMTREYIIKQNILPVHIHIWGYTSKALKSSSPKQSAENH